MGSRLASEGLIDKLVGAAVHLAWNPGKQPFLEGHEGLLDFFAKLGGSRILVPSARYVIDHVHIVGEGGDVEDSSLCGRIDGQTN